MAKKNISFANEIISTMADLNKNGVFDSSIELWSKYKKEQEELLKSAGGTYEKKYKEAGGPEDEYKD